MPTKKFKTYAFIDASNLFYGGEKSLGWKIDYQKLLSYLEEKYNVSEVFYFGGVETHGYYYNYLINETVPLEKLKQRQRTYIRVHGQEIGKTHIESSLCLVSIYYHKGG